MNNNHPDYYNESVHLEQVCTILQAEISKKDSEIKSYKSEIVSIRKNMWDNARHGFGSNEMEAMIEATQYISAIKNEENSYIFTKGLLDKYNRLLCSPYFARIDFCEEGSSSPEKIYIGLYSFIRTDTMEVVIHDWRAPVSSIFYEYELGPASYKAYEGTTGGEVTVKRQYKIKDSKLLYMFDSSVKIDDEILQEILSGNASERMKSIVTTIQKEQNRVIRFDEGSMLIVQGAAGSGKTSIALHRIAYLLYKDRNMTSKNIIIFSPSNAFNDYISNVLPELGENNVIQTTFSEYTAKFIARGFRMENLNDHMEYLLSEKAGSFSNIRRRGYKFKNSQELLAALRQYTENLVCMKHCMRDVYYQGRIVVRGSELRKIYDKCDPGLPVNKRLAVVRERAFYLIDKVREQKKVEIKRRIEKDTASLREAAANVRLELQREFKGIKEEIQTMTKVNLYNAYSGFYESEYYLKAGKAYGLSKDEIEEIGNYTTENQKGRIMNYEDAAVLMYLKCILEEIPDTADIKHIVIDEAQDYSPIQYEIFKRLFPDSSFTILGDINQSINPYRNTTSLSAAADVFGRPDTAVLKLSKSYRSTIEISAFAAEILPADVQAESLNRAGELPRLVKLDGCNDIGKVLAADIRYLQQQGMQSIAILCRTREECSQVYKLLHNEIKLDLITKDEDMLRKGVSILPSYLCKGLEFDAALVYGADTKAYNSEGDRKLLYTLCTRALHRLTVYYSGQLSPILNAIDETLYRFIQQQ